ncbi:MAG: MerC family mercury resistance protein [Acidobacteriota bacterium]
MSDEQASMGEGSGSEDARGERIDRFGVVASSLCAIHCAATALLPAAFGILGLGWLLAHEAEWVFTLVAVAFAAGALIFTWRRHRSYGVVVLLVLGIVGLLASRGIESASAHHGHHEDPHAAHVEHGEEGEHGSAESHRDHDGETTDDHHDGAGADGDSHGDLHLLGTVVGVLAGLFLMAGHLLSIRMTRRRSGDS